MKARNLPGVLLLFCTLALMSCSEKDDGSRGFMSNATIMGNSTDGYYCYLHGGGLAISYSKALEGIERGYFAFNYMENDWKISDDNMIYIDNAHVYPYTVFNVIHPISKEEAENAHITDEESEIPPFLSVSSGYRGFFDLHTRINVENLISREKVLSKLNLIYDPARQTPETLLLELHYSLDIPKEWSDTGFDYGLVSCDISSLAALQQWNDSVTIVVEAADEKLHQTKISKNDFFKPEMKIE